MFAVFLRLCRRLSIATVFALVCGLAAHALFPAEAGAAAYRTTPAEAALSKSSVSGGGFLPSGPFEGIRAMGGGEREALEPRGGGGSNPFEEFFAGSFTGALLFGYPYSGVGLPDVGALALLALLLLRIGAGRRRDSGDGRFNAGGGSDLFRKPGAGSRKDSFDSRGKTFDDDENEDTADRGPAGPRAAPPAGPRRGGGPANPRDNAWSRRLRGEQEPRNTQPPAGGRDGSGRELPDGDEQKTPRQRRAEAMWAHLSSKQPQNVPVQPEMVAEGVQVPADFDVHDFLEGARALYTRLQNAWAARKVDDLAPFTTEQMLRLLQDHAAGNPDPETVDVLLVNAELRDISRNGQDEEARVRFNATLRLGDAESPSETAEVWRFVRGPSSGGLWRLAGIEEA